MSADLSWIVIRTQGGCEAKAAGFIERECGFQALFARCWAERVRSRRGTLAMVQEPLFPCYLFVGLGPADEWQRAMTMPGVIDPVRASRDVPPTPVPAPVMADLIARLDHASGCLPIADPATHKMFVPLAPVRIKDGPFRGLNAIYQSRDGQARVVLLLELMQRWTRLSVPVGSVEAL